MNEQLDRLRTDYRRLLSLAERYPETRRKLPGACGEWSPHDVLAHLVGWLTEARSRFEAYAAGSTEKVRYDTDDFNAKAVEARKDKDWDALLTELRQALNDLLAVVEALPASHFEQEPRYQKWIADLARDCETHTAQLVGFQHY